VNSCFLQKGTNINMSEQNTTNYITTTTTTTVLWPFFQDHPGEPVPEENLWTL